VENPEPQWPFIVSDFPIQHLDFSGLPSETFQVRFISHPVQHTRQARGGRHEEIIWVQRRNFLRLSSWGNPAAFGPRKQPKWWIKVQPETLAELHAPLP